MKTYCYFDDDDDDYIPSGNLFSDCCGALPLYDLDEYNCGVCSKCKEHASFSQEPNE